MALAYAKIEIEIREISLRDRPKELYKVSEKGTVPVVITTNDKVIDESLDIMLWALKNNLKQTWLPKEYKKELRMIDMNDTIFKKWLDKYKYHDRYPDESKEFYRENCRETLDTYETQLKNTKYLIANKINITDIAIFPFVRQFANVDYIWFENNYENLKKWLNEISNSNLFKSIMEKYDLWDPQNATIVNFDNELLEYR